MTLHEYRDVEQGTEQWHDLRRGIVTASTIGKLITPTLKVASNETSRSIVATIVAERLTGESEPSFTTDDMMRGILHEPIARERYAEVNGVEVDEVGFAIRTLDNGHKVGASPDGLVGESGGLEVKAPRAKTHVRTVIANEVPAHYMAQVQTNLLVFGRQWWDFVSFCAGQPMFTKRVYPDPKWHQAIADAVDAFEKAATEMTSEYLTRCDGLPATERIPDMEVVI